MTFEEIYTAYWPKVYRLCIGYVNDADWAKDICQETFIKVWEQLPKFRNEAGVGTWVFRIASNNCLGQLERSKRIPKGELLNDVAETQHQPIDKELDMLYQFISELPETDRIIISLELEDIKQADIAAIVGISEANVRVKNTQDKRKVNAKIQ